MEEWEEWVWPKVKAWSHGVRTLNKIANRHPWSAYVVLGMLLQLEWK